MIQEKGYPIATVMFTNFIKEEKLLDTVCGVEDIWKTFDYIRNICINVVTNFYAPTMVSTRYHVDCAKRNKKRRK